jgi:hypothetical protein
MKKSVWLLVIVPMTFLLVGCAGSTWTTMKTFGGATIGGKDTTVTIEKSYNSVATLCIVGYCDMPFRVVTPDAEVQMKKLDANFRGGGVKLSHIIPCSGNDYDGYGYYGSSRSGYYHRRNSFSLEFTVIPLERNSDGSLKEPLVLTWSYQEGRDRREEMVVIKVKNGQLTYDSGTGRKRR